MTTFHRDDLTGKEYVSDRNLMEFGIVQQGTVSAAFETHETVYQEEPERIAERMHEEVDAWLEDTQEYLEREADDEEADPDA